MDGIKMPVGIEELAAAASAQRTERIVRNPDGMLRRLLAAADLLAVLIALVSTLSITEGTSLSAWSLAALPLMLLLFKIYGLYDLDAKRFSHSTVDDIPRLVHALVIGVLALWLYSKYTPMHRLAFFQNLTFGLEMLAFVLVARACARSSAARLIGVEHALLVGDGRTARAFASKLEAHPEFRVRLAGVLSAAPDPEQFQALLRKHRIARLVLSSPDVEPERAEDLVRTCRRLGIKVSLLPRFSEFIGAAVELDDVEGVTALGLSRPQLPRSSRIMKRVVDLLVSLPALLIASPVLLVAAIAIKLDSRGPVLFAQDRVGRNGRLFQVLKLRTMVADAESKREALLAQSEDPDWLKLDEDPRVTRVGRFLRRLSLDELPQLWNVVRGEMSIVGPRPLIPAENERVQWWAKERLDLTPGITGYWQVLGRTRIPFEEMVKLDYLYVMNWSLWEDVRLMLKTMPAVISGHGAN